MKSCALMSLFLFCAALALAALAFLLIQASPATELQRRAAVEYERQRDAQDLAERAQRAEQNARFTDAIMPALEVAIMGLVICLPLAAAGVGYAWLRRRGRDHGELVYPNADGLLPVSRAGLLTGQYDAHSAAAITGYHAARIEAARNTSQPIPSSVTHYAPKYGSAAPRPAAGQDAPALAAPPDPVRVIPAPAFGDLLSRGLLGPGRFALGWDPARGMPAYGTFGDLYSVAVLGATGSGKSTTARALISQTALNDGRLIVIDPHLQAARDSLAGDLAPLRSAFLLPPVDDDPTAVKHALETVLDLLEQRKAGATGPVVLVVCDEWTSMVSRGGPRAELLTRTMRLLAVEGRKLGLHGMVCMQDATKEAVGPLRDVLSSAYVHRSRPQHARMIAPGLKADTWSLQPGQAWLDQVSAAPRLLTMPDCTPADVAAVGRLLSPPTPTGPRSDSASWQQPPSQEPITPADGGRTVDGRRPTGQTEAESREATDRPPKTVQDRPPLRVLRPQTLTEKARAAGMELAESEWRDLAAMDAGKTPQALAAATVGATEGRPYRRRRDELMRLADLVRNWPEGEPWSNGSEGK